MNLSLTAPSSLARSALHATAVALTAWPSCAPSPSAHEDAAPLGEAGASARDASVETATDAACPAPPTTRLRVRLGRDGRSTPVALPWPGGAGLVLGVVGQVVGWGHADNFDDAGCVLHGTSPTQASSTQCGQWYNLATGWFTASTASFIAGGVLVASGTALWLLAPRARTTSSLSVRCAPRLDGVGVACEGTF